MEQKTSSLIPEVNLSDYDYELPKSRIAKYPANRREESKLLYFNAASGELSNKKFSDIINLLPNNSHLFINSTKVISARLNLRKPTGGKAEILCVSPVSPSSDPQITMAAKTQCKWECIIGGRNIKQEMVLNPVSELDGLSFAAKILSKHENKATVEFSWNPKELSFAEVINKTGKIPLPPYINRQTEYIDSERYQTVYAKSQGSVAAPTAGLHLTDEIIEKLRERLKISELLLHVGPGTFQPVENEDVTKHEMHSEQLFVSIQSVEELLRSVKAGSRIVPVGTTSMRTLESLYIFGLKLLKGYSPASNKLMIEQWDGFKYSDDAISSEMSIDAVLKFMEDNSLELLNGETRLFIVPGYRFGLCNAIVTNFHLPKSTLLMLVSALIGRENMKIAYRFALDNDFRFLSYGDSSLLIS